ncbi:MAG TPA: prolipoprotein diacylglyceryl transferase [Thermodesulfobacteriota bacterium]|nr:prolipoprotein diacylglyceryl transferase [Thermodesulfobacteriota bacterium]
MLPFPAIDPVIFSIGPFQVRWYGTMYILGFLASYLLVRLQLRRQKPPIMAEDRVEDLYFYLVLGLIVGARLGYVIFYNFRNYLEHPLEVVAVWQGGMSFHGGLIGAFLAACLFSRKYRVNLWALGDLVIVTAPIGLGLGRLGNFINGELFGRVTTQPWGMVFPQGGPLPRHPSQLYEAFLEGLVLFVWLWWSKGKNRISGGMVARFLIGYGLFRIIVEFFRDPDPQIGLLFNFLTLGQLLSFGMVLSGFFLLYSRPSQISRA